MLPIMPVRPVEPVTGLPSGPTTCAGGFIPRPGPTLVSPGALGPLFPSGLPWFLGVTSSFCCFRLFDCRIWLGLRWLLANKKCSCHQQKQQSPAGECNHGFAFLTRPTIGPGESSSGSILTCPHSPAQRRFAPMKQPWQKSPETERICDGGYQMPTLGFQTRDQQFGPGFPHVPYAKSSFTGLPQGQR